MHLSSYDKLLHELMNKFTKNESNKKIKKINDLKYSSKRINVLKEIIDKLDKLEKNDFIKIIIKGYEDLIEFINKDRKVRIALLGLYSSKKSTILNCIIGEQILPISSDECTRRGIIIRYHGKELFFFYSKEEEGSACSDNGPSSEEDNTPTYSSNIDLKLLYITIPHQTVPIDSNYIFYLTFFSSCNIKSKIADMNDEDLDGFDFYIPEECMNFAKAVSVEEDPYTKDDCNFYIKVKYNINTEKIKLPNKIEGSDKYTITVNEALINQEYNLVNESNLNEDLNKNIILIEKINELSNDKRTFTINVGIPICKQIFGTSGENLVAILNEESNYNCKFTDISSPYNSFEKTITCTSDNIYNTVNSINSFEFNSEYNDDYIFFYSKEEEGSFCRYDGPPCGEDNTPTCDPDIDLKLLYITFPNQEKPIEPYYIFYLTFFSTCNIKSKIEDMNKEDLDVFHFYIPEECMNLAKAVLVEEDPFTKDKCNSNYYIRIKYYSYSHKIKLPNKIEGSNKYKITVNEALINQEYDLVNESNLNGDLNKNTKGEEGTNCFEIATFDLNDNLNNKKSDILHPNSDPLNSNIYLVNDRNAVFNIFFDQKYFRFIQNVKFYVKYKSMDSKDITEYCIPTLSRYINYTQVTCQFDLFDVLQEDINSLINSIITIQYGSSEDDLKDYKKYYIKRGMEQPYFHDFKGSINRNYYKDGVKVDL